MDYLFYTTSLLEKMNCARKDTLHFILALEDSLSCYHYPYCIYSKERCFWIGQQKRGNNGVWEKSVVGVLGLEGFCSTVPILSLGDSTQILY